MKNSNDTIKNRIRDLPTCSAVPQPTALPRAPITARYFQIRQASKYLQCSDRKKGA